MARPYKQMIGSEYSIEDDGSEYTVYCYYRCPYCGEDTHDYFTVNKDDTDGNDMIFKGAFFENLECENCGKASDVRFYSSMRR